MKTILDIFFTYCFLCLLQMKFFMINFFNCTLKQGMQFALFGGTLKKTNFKIILGNQHPAQSRLARKTQALIWNFLICISNTIKDQFGLFLFSRTWKNLSTRAKENFSKISVYCVDFAPDHETVRFESKPCVSWQNHETQPVCT